MELEDVSVGSIFSFPDKPVESVDIVCKSKSCCNGTPLHPDAYRHPVVILDCDNNSVDVLKVRASRSALLSRLLVDRNSTDYLDEARRTICLSLPQNSWSKNSSQP